jgi:hypothetical protein
MVEMVEVTLVEPGTKRSWQDGLFSEAVSHSPGQKVYLGSSTMHNHSQPWRREGLCSGGP